MRVELKENERIDDLQFKGLKIIQDATKFCFGMDAVLLSDFADVRMGDRVVDLGTGTGIIPILLAGKSEAAKIYGVEIQADMVEMAQRSVVMNNLEGRVEIIQGDLKNAPDFLGESRFEVVLSNPPYKKAGSGKVNPNEAKAIARHEIKCSLEDVLKAASSLLINGGRFAMVHRAQRLVDILSGMRQFRLEPKRIRLVYPNVNRPPNLVLVEGILNGRPFLKWMPPLFVYDLNGNYTREINEIYFGKRSDGK